MPAVAAEDVLEGIERVIVAAPYTGVDKPEPTFFDDEAGMARRDADRVFSVVPLADERMDKRSGGSIYRKLTVGVGMQHHRNKKTRRKMLADALITEVELRHLKALIEALAVPVLGIHQVRLISGPRFDNTNSPLGRTKAMTNFVLEVEYTTTG